MALNQRGFSQALSWSMAQCQEEKNLHGYIPYNPHLLSKPQRDSIFLILSLDEVVRFSKRKNQDAWKMQLICLFENYQCKRFLGLELRVETPRCSPRGFATTFPTASRASESYIIWCGNEPAMRRALFEIVAAAVCGSNPTSCSHTDDVRVVFLPTGKLEFSVTFSSSYRGQQLSRHDESIFHRSRYM